MPLLRRGVALSIDNALPGLCTARAAGRLVPFLGSGISHPYCRNWKDFIKDLAKQLGDESSTPSAIDAATTNSEVLYRIADRLAAWLRLRPLAERRTILREALRDPLKAESGLPAQAVALAGHYWPLIITSNYDDIVPVAMRDRSNGPIRIRGRSPQDCTEVVRMLDMLQTPLVWYIQGHIAGIVDCSVAPERSQALDLLLDEVVLGHQQYQQAINSGMAFRRAFSEVFRRRSLIFVGSGLSESYFVNLIAEALFSLGPSAAPHYALFTTAELAKIDPEFLAVRLGITPVVYGDKHAELPAVLEKIGEADGASTKQRTPIRSAFSYSLPRSGGKIAKDQVITEVKLCFKPLSAPGADACVGLSVGINALADPPSPRLGPMARSFINEHPDICDRADTFHPIPPRRKDET